MNIPVNFCSLHGINVRTKIKELAAKNKLDENSITKVRESIQEKASRLRGRVGTYEMISNIFGLKAPENMRVRASWIWLTTTWCSRRI